MLSKQQNKIVSETGDEEREKFHWNCKEEFGTEELGMEDKNHFQDL